MGQLSIYVLGDCEPNGCITRNPPMLPARQLEANVQFADITGQVA